MSVLKSGFCNQVTSVLKLNYFTEHCKWDPIAYFDTYVA